jgi:20S proteasome subunit alpha 6
LEDLVLHGLRALRDTLAQDKELLAQNTSIGIVGLDTKFTLYDNDDVRGWLEKLGDVGSTRGRRPPEEPEPEATEDAPVTDAPPPEETDTVEPIETDV